MIANKITVFLFSLALSCYYKKNLQKLTKVHKWEKAKQICNSE